jgi:hypothetical protein
VSCRPDHLLLSHLNIIHSGYWFAYNAMSKYIFENSMDANGKTDCCRAVTAQKLFARSVHQFLANEKLVNKSFYTKIWWRKDRRQTTTTPIWDALELSYCKKRPRDFDPVSCPVNWKDDQILEHAREVEEKLRIPRRLPPLQLPSMYNPKTPSSYDIFMGNADLPGELDDLGRVSFKIGVGAAAGAAILIAAPVIVGTGATTIGTTTTANIGTTIGTITIDVGTTVAPAAPVVPILVHH